MAPDNAINEATNNARRPSLSETFFAHAFTEGALRFRYDIDPAKHKVTAAPGDTLLGIAAAYRSAMNIESPANAAHALALQNGILPANGRWQDVRLAVGQSLVIPVARGMEIVTIPIEPGTTIADITTSLKEKGRLPPSLENNPERAAKVIDAINPLREQLYNMAYNVKDMVSDPSFSLPVPIKALVRDDFEKIEPLQTPGLTKRGNTTLVISEPESAHLDTVLDFARSYSRALTAEGAVTPKIYGYAEQDHGIIINGGLHTLPKPDPASNDYLIFNHSYRRSFDSFDRLMHNPEFRELKTIHFLAAGNSADDFTRDADENIAIPYQLGPRSYLVGAAHPNPDGTVKLADYTSVGADIVAPPMALHNGELIGGTSFASPMMAALNQKMLELYGGTLTQEEIMSAAYMSTDMKLTETNNQRYYDLHGFTLTPGPVDVVYLTNGGGRPYSERAGAGMVDPQRWQETLNTMAGIKMRMEYTPETIREAIDVGKLKPKETVNLDGSTSYIYTVPITQDMTLDRLALILPQVRHMTDPDKASEQNVFIESPSGFTYALPATPHGTVGTSAFALEDVKAGDTITIVSGGSPLADIAQIVINGQGDGNVIQATRDLLQEQGKMPHPITFYAGARLNSEVEAEAAAARAALEKDQPVLPSFGTGLQNLQGVMPNPDSNPLPPVLPPNIKF